MQVRERTTAGSGIIDLPSLVPDVHRLHTIYDSYDIVSSIYLFLGCLFSFLAFLVLMKMLCLPTCRDCWKRARTSIGAGDRRKRE